MRRAPCSARCLSLGIKPREDQTPGLTLVLTLGNFAAAQAARANTNLLRVRGARNLGLHRMQVHVPAAAGLVVGVRNVIAELRTFAADTTYLRHVELQNGGTAWAFERCTAIQPDRSNFGSAALIATQWA